MPSSTGQIPLFSEGDASASALASSLVIGEIPVGYCQCGCGAKTNIVQENNPRRGQIRGTPFKYLAGHNRRRSPVDYLEQDRGYETPCWIWQHATFSNGYGVINRDGFRGCAHRFFYERANGATGLVLDHLCRVKRCVNPEHLEPVTQAENVQRGAKCKLTADDVREIRASSETQKELAARFGVAYATINGIVLGHRWANIT
jgi:hypothetical protein